ncbi:Zn-dependent oxidoreductase, NADPH:quinone reductase [Mycolicibacterium chubuense NBB4]|uniref:Zn-dependent oxidoreductase, NADPH:quinone reductase n=1 Tax=Mycolicibacterium chubuense (strain NBB4) TaxID=710421 RepID=I4BCB6_MYCCN|nr:NADPH:quinone oxidoreductase family protein [Mycolicibacterium chubuense]AFM14923.1 Zn-dependent oxidoreductase, NADPH:quinone reductase [Mycolicibacterium chubuense NBB4]
MKALVAQELSGPAGFVYTDVTDPVGDDNVIVDVRAAGVCFPDLLLLRGEYQMRLDPPFVPGMEVAGVVRSAPAATGLVAGQRVSAFTMLGGYAEQVAVAPGSVVPTSAGVDDASAAALLGNYYTMYFALHRRGALQAGETVLVLGSAGGVGTAAVQIAKALGARVIAMVHRPSAIEFVESLGADVVLPLADGWLDAVKTHTDGRGVDVVVDPIGGAAFDDAVRAMATEGRLLVIGFAAGGIPTVKVNRLLLRNVSVVGVGWGEFVNRNPGAQAEVGAGLAKLVDAGLRPPAPVRFPLSAGAEALQALADGKIRGKLVLEPARATSE